MLSKKQVWQARQRFLSAIRKTIRATKSSQRAKEIQRLLTEYTTRLNGYIEKSRQYNAKGIKIPRSIWDEIEGTKEGIAWAKERYDEEIQSPIDLLESLVTCGLHPYMVGDQVSYCPKGKNRKKPGHRRATSIVRFLKMVFPSCIEWPEYIVNNLAEALRVTASKYVVRLIEGQDIVTAYRYSVGSNSCMTGIGHGRQQTTVVYAQNPHAVKMAIVLPEELKDAPFEALCCKGARCLVWFGEHGVHIDRIYCMGGLCSVTEYLYGMVANHVNSLGFNVVSDNYGNQKGSFYTLLKSDPNVGFPYLDSLSLQYSASKNGASVNLLTINMSMGEVQAKIKEVRVD